MVRQAHHPEHGRRTDGVSEGEKRQLSPWVEHGDSNPVFDITRLTHFFTVISLRSLIHFVETLSYWATVLP